MNQKHPTVGQLIRTWREARGLSQKALGERLETSGSLIGAYERGRSSPTMRQLRRICTALGTDPLTLLAGPPASGFLQTAYASLPDLASVREAVVPIPFVECWQGEPVAELDCIAWMVSQKVVPHAGCLITLVPDNALFPELICGDAVLVDPEVRRPRSMSLVLLEIDHKVTVRRFLLRKDGRTYAAASGLHPSFAAGPDVRLLGRIVALVQRRLIDTKATVS